MRMRLVLILVLSIAAMGADCGGGSSGASASSSSVPIASPGEDHGDFAPPVPEPSALLVFGTGLLLAGAAARRKR